MGRPKTALISREAVLSVALGIIDADGLDSLSVRRIASVMGVNGASLYHHFKNKDEIVTGAAELALVRTPLKSMDGSRYDWEKLLIAGTIQLRDFLLDHPELVPIFAQRRALGLANQFLEGGIKRLIEHGMPVSIIIPLSEALETFALGWAMRHNSRKIMLSFDPPPDVYPLLYKAAQERSVTRSEVFNLAMMTLIEGFKQGLGAGIPTLPGSA